MKGDYYRYLAEVATGDTRNGKKKKKNLMNRILNFNNRNFPITIISQSGIGSLLTLTTNTRAGNEEIQYHSHWNFKVSPSV